jgi:hypothetical protein
MTLQHTWENRDGRRKQYENKRLGGTVIVHFIKKNMWFLEAAQALLEGEEYSEAEWLQRREGGEGKEEEEESGDDDTPMTHE